ncbi:MAG: S9 family peptidase [Chloroflexota bacterium]
MGSSHYDLEKLLKVPYVDPYGGYSFSPDGGWLCFSWNWSGQWEIYQVRLDGEHHPVQVSGGPGGKSTPRYSPDGKRLAYVLDEDGSEAFDICVLELATGEHTNLTPHTPDAIQPNYCWSPDGKQLAFISDRTGRFEVYVMPVEGRAARHVFAGAGPAWDLRWSPEGGYLAVVCEGTGQDYATYLVPAAGGEAFRLAEAGQGLNACEPCWSPDGRRLAFSSGAHGFNDIGIFEVVTHQVSWVTRGEGEKTFPDWSPDGRRLVYILGRGPDTWLAVHELDEAGPMFYQVEPGVTYLPRFTPDGQRVAFVFGNARQPEDIWLLRLADGVLQQVTHSLPDDLSPEDFVMPREVMYPSLDGRSVPALLFQPTETGRVHLRLDGQGDLTTESTEKNSESTKKNVFRDGMRPAVVVIHGGPNWLYQYLWYPLFQHMVGRGWVVLAPNYRGSTGYGREWQLANRFDLGGGDAQDVVAGADFLVRESLADPRRVAVTGRSHGGYLTMCCLTQYPQRWAGGSAVVPFLNWFTSHANSRQDLQHWDIENMGNPRENHELWRQRSPFFYLDQIQAPVQLICGANDPRCPASESIAGRDALLALGKTVDFVLYTDEGHAFLKTENVVDAEVRRVAFLAKILDGAD